MYVCMSCHVMYVCMYEWCVCIYICTCVHECMLTFLHIISTKTNRRLCTLCSLGGCRRCVASEAVHMVYPQSYCHSAMFTQIWRQILLQYIHGVCTDTWQYVHCVIKMSDMYICQTFYTRVHNRATHELWLWSDSSEGIHMCIFLKTSNHNNVVHCY
jgi:hypothetical protein